MNIEFTPPRPKGERERERSRSKIGLCSGISMVQVSPTFCLTDIDLDTLPRFPGICAWTHKCWNTISVIYIRKQHFRIFIRIRYSKFDIDFVYNFAIAYPDENPKCCFLMYIIDILSKCWYAL